MSDLNTKHEREAAAVKLWLAQEEGISVSAFDDTEEWAGGVVVVRGKRESGLAAMKLLRALVAKWMGAPSANWHRTIALEEQAPIGCPCSFPEIEPCQAQCSCRTPVLSAGCLRCARYGSLEQRLASARRIGVQRHRRGISRFPQRRLQQHGPRPARRCRPRQSPCVGRDSRCM